MFTSLKSLPIFRTVPTTTTETTTIGLDCEVHGAESAWLKNDEVAQGTGDILYVEENPNENETLETAYSVNTADEFLNGVMSQSGPFFFGSLAFKLSSSLCNRQHWSASTYWFIKCGKDGKWIVLNFSVYLQRISAK